MKSKYLRQCPRCDSDDVSIEEGSVGYYVQCENCGFYPLKEQPTPSGAEYLWNFIAKNYTGEKLEG